MKRINFQRIGSGLVRLIVYSVVGAAVGLAIWYFLVRAVEFWRYDAAWGSIVPAWVSTVPTWVSTTAFLIVLVVAGFIVPEILDRLWGWFLSPDGRSTKDGWGKSFRTLITAVIVPLAVLAVVDVVPWFNKPFFPPPNDEYQLVEQAADTVMASNSSATRLAGIQALAAVPSKDSLTMLTKIVEQQPSILNDQSSYNALSQAIATHGSDARTWLLNTYKAHPTSAGAAAGTALESGLYERYFQPSFSDLEAEVKRAVADPAQQKDLLLKLAADESQLKSDLADMEAQQAVLQSGDRTLDFVLDTLASFKPTEDADIAQLAKQVAGDGANGVGTRRRAILLVAQFGDSEDYASLLPYLQDPDESLRAAALVAMRTLYEKGKALPVTGTGTQVP